MQSSGGLVSACRISACLKTCLRASSVDIVAVWVVVLLGDIVVGVDVSFLRGYPYTDVVMVACDGLGEFCVVLREVLFF